jgi:hypothetical protein
MIFLRDVGQVEDPLGLFRENVNLGTRGDMCQMEAHFDPFEGIVNLGLRSVHSLR